MSSINYNLEKIRAFVFDVDGVLSPSTIPLDAVTGAPVRMANIKDGYAMQLAVRQGYHMAVITGADTPAMQGRYASLGVKDLFMKVSVKLPVLKHWMERNGLDPSEVMYVGDDIPDYQAMKYVGLPIAPADAADDIKEIANTISKYKGGYGVARDVIEQVLRTQGRWLGDDKAFGW